MGRGLSLAVALAMQGQDMREVDAGSIRALQ
jgi:hypothetical protein